MSEDEIVVAIVFGSIVAIVVISLLSSLLKTWIKQKNNSYDEEKFDRLAKAFIKHKKDTERRLQNIETTATHGQAETKSASSSAKSLNETKPPSIEFDNKDTADTEKQESKKGHGNLRNMLKD